MEFKEFLKKYWKLFLIFIIPLLLSLLPILIPGKESKYAFVLFLVILYRLTECVPCTMTSILPLIFLPILGISFSQTISLTYFKSNNVMVFASLILSKLFESSNLNKYVAYKFLILCNCDPKRSIIGVIVLGSVLSFCLPYVFVVAMLLPIVNSMMVEIVLSDKVFDNDVEGEIPHTIRKESDSTEGPHIVKFSSADYDSDSSEESFASSSESGLKDMLDKSKYARNFALAIFLALSYSSLIGSLCSFISSPNNVVLRLYMTKVHSDKWLTFWTFLGVSIPATLLLLIVLWVTLIFVFLPNEYFFSCFLSAKNSPVKLLKNLIVEKYSRLEKLRFDQWCFIIVFVLLAILLFVRELLVYFRLKVFLGDRLISIETIVLIALLILTICPKKNIFKNKTYQHILDWRALRNPIIWKAILLIGCGNALAQGFLDSGSADLLKTSILRRPEQSSIILLVIIAFSLFLTQFYPNQTVAIYFLPVFEKLVSTHNINPIYILLPFTLSLGLSFTLPISNPANAIVYSHGYIRDYKMLIIGIALTAIGFLILYFISAVWLGIVFNVASKNYNSSEVIFSNHTFNPINL